MFPYCGILLWVTNLRNHARRKLLRVALLVVLACLSLALAWKVRGADFGSVDELMAIAGTFAGVWSLGAAVFQLLPAPEPPPDVGDVADQLASSVRAQWTDEADARELRESRVIPLSWAATERQVAAPAEAIFGTRAGRVLRMSLEGRLEDDFSTASAQLTDGYRRIPSGRLVVLGEPGGGKTVLALMLTLGLLAQRPPQSPVPVLLSVSSWDPVSKSLDDWIVDTLAAQYYGGQAHAPRLLLDRQMLLPVLDGLDEIPESARRNAVRGLNSACSDGRGLVLTCRSAEYQDVIEGGSPALRRAPVVEVAPVSVTDAVTYLREVDRSDGVGWEPVYAHLREDPESAAATALSTPLALSLARSVYRHSERNPAELLDFDARHAVEDHLVDHIISAAYAPEPGSLPGQDDGVWQQEARQAEKYLTFLATYLHHYRERDLAWWRMSGRLFSRWVGLVVGIGIGLFAVLLVAVVLKPLGVEDRVEWSVLAGVGVAVLAMLAWYAAPDRPPGRVSFALRGSRRRLRAGFGAGFALTALLAAMVLGTVAVITTFNGSWNTGELADFGRLAAFAAGSAVAIGVAFAVHQWLNTPPEGSIRATPTGLLRQDRSSSLVGAGVAGITFAATAFPLLIVTVSLTFLVFQALTGWAGEPRLSDILARVAEDIGAYGSPLEVLRATVLPGAVFTMLMVLQRAWTRFTLLRLFLAARGRVPWRFVRFLTEARDRQLLRQSGGAYQFRHIRLQERLAGRSLAGDRVPVTRAQTVRRRRIQLTVTGSALAVGLLLVALIVPADPSRMTLPTGSVEAAGFGPAGTHTLVTASKDGTVRRWDTKSGEKVWERKIRGLIDWTDYDYGDEDYSFDMTVEVNKEGILLFGVNDDQSPREWRIPWSRSQPVESRNLRDSAVTYTAAHGRYRLGMNGEETEFRDVRADGHEKKNFNPDFPAGVEYLGKYSGGAVSDNGVAIVSISERDVLDVYKAGKKTRTCDNVPGALWAIDGAGGRFASAEGASAYGWYDDCKKSWSLDTHKPVDALAMDGEGKEVALTVDGMTRIYETSALD